MMGENDGSDLLSELKAEIEEVQAALGSSEKQAFAEVLAGFETLARRTVESKRAEGYQFLIEEVRALIDVPPPPSWDGVIALTEK